METGTIQYYRPALRFFFIMGMVYVVGPFILFVYIGEASAWWAFLPCAMFGVGLMFFPAISAPRLYMRVFISERDITSYSFFKRQCCRVELDKPVYYAKYYLRMVRGAEHLMLAVSNEPFVCSPLEAKPGMNPYDKRLVFQGHYDRSKIVVLPYDEETKPWLPLEQWTGTYGITP